jgi:hypothetical protein
MIQIGFDIQTYCLLCSTGSIIWWPLCTTLGVVYGYAYMIPMIIVGNALPYLKIPRILQDTVRERLKQETPVVFMEPPTSIGYKPEVILLIPHGFLCVEGLVVYQKWISDNSVDSTLFVDKKLQPILPGCTLVLNVLGLEVGITGHANIDQHMRTRRTVAAFPGGFIEAVGGTQDEQILYLGTISYWLKMCRRHGFGLRIFHTYNGSEMVTQSAYGMQSRVQIAGKYHIPVVLPTGIKKVTTLVVRCLYYETIPETVDTVVKDIEHYVAIDKKSSLFPVPHRKYTVITARL